MLNNIRGLACPDGYHTETNKKNIQELESLGEMKDLNLVNVQIHLNITPDSVSYQHGNQREFCCLFLKRGMSCNDVEILGRKCCRFVDVNVMI